MASQLNILGTLSSCRDLLWLQARQSTAEVVFTSERVQTCSNCSVTASGQIRRSAVFNLMTFSVR